MIGYPNLTYLLIGQNFVNIMITELSERRIDLHPYSSWFDNKDGNHTQSSMQIFIDIFSIIEYSFNYYEDMNRR